MQRNPREAKRFGPGRGPAVDLVPFGGTATTVPAPPGIPTLTVPFVVRGRGHDSGHRRLAEALSR